MKLMSELEAKVEKEAKEKLIAAIQVKEKHAREEAIDKVKEEVLAVICGRRREKLRTSKNDFG